MSSDASLGADSGALAVLSDDAGAPMGVSAATEPDAGSDVAGIKVTATPAPGPNGEDGWLIRTEASDLVHRVRDLAENRFFRVARAIVTLAEIKD